MKKKKDDYVIRFRNVIKEFCVTKLEYWVERGTYDSAFQSFLNAGSKDCEFNFRISLFPNDIMVMRLLLGEKMTPEILSRLKKIWDKEG